MRSNNYIVFFFTRHWAVSAFYLFTVRPTQGPPHHLLQNFFLYLFCFDFRKNKWSNQKFREIYIWCHTPRRQELLSSWGTALGVVPTVGCTARWGQIPAVLRHGGRNPSVVARGAMSPSVVPHSGRVLAP
jgi:hypothetical protein